MNNKEHYKVLNDSAFTLLVRYKEGHLGTFLNYNDPTTSIGMSLDWCITVPQLFRNTISLYRYEHFTLFELYVIQLTLESVIEIGLKNKWIRGVRL